MCYSWDRLVARGWLVLPVLLMASVRFDSVRRSHDTLNPLVLCRPSISVVDEGAPGVRHFSSPAARVPAAKPSLMNMAWNSDRLTFLGRCLCTVHPLAAIHEPMIDFSWMKRRSLARPSLDAGGAASTSWPCTRIPFLATTYSTLFQGRKRRSTMRK